MLYEIGQAVVLESCDCSPGEREGSDHSGGRGTLDVFVGNIKELLECAFPGVVDRYADL